MKKNATETYTDKKGRRYTRHYEDTLDKAATHAAKLVDMVESGHITPLEGIGYAAAAISDIAYKVNKNSELATIAVLLGELGNDAAGEGGEDE